MVVVCPRVVSNHAFSWIGAAGFTRVVGFVCRYHRSGASKVGGGCGQPDQGPAAGSLGLRYETSVDGDAELLSSPGQDSAVAHPDPVYPEFCCTFFDLPGGGWGLSHLDIDPPQTLW